MFSSVLIANRGEIAVRVIRTLRALGVRSVAVYTDADVGARHAAEADEAVRIESYLSIEAVLDAVALTGAQAVHPGYGFLSENAAFARACAAAGVVFVGPPVSAIEAMGDKIAAKATVHAAGVPVVPGSVGAGLSDDALAAQAAELGLPLLIKPSAGGGGKGMRVVHDTASLAGELAAARREARGAFGDAELLLERYVERPRHIEIQVLADRHGGVVHLGERECSLQRRHQKIVEEAPSPLLDDASRARMGAAAVEVARAVGYTGAGTVEFIVPGGPDSADRTGPATGVPDFYFLEMNTRLQVEHPVTELVTGLDLVEWQLRIAAGEPLAMQQEDVRLDGHAVEARVYAETVHVQDGTRGFLPTGGRVLALAEPELPHVRVDSGLRAGMTIGSGYDPMLAKIIAWAPGREEALDRLDAALAETAVLGVQTNLAFLRSLLADPEVRAGRLDTGLVDRHLAAAGSQFAAGPPEHVVVAAALAGLLAAQARGDPDDLWAQAGGWRLGEPAWTVWRLGTGDDVVEVRTRGRAAGAEVSIEAGGNAPASAPAATPEPASAERAGDWLAVTWRGVRRRYRVVESGTTTWLGMHGETWALATLPRYPSRSDDAAAVGSGRLTSPMPGTVLAVKVAEGDTVRAGQPLVIIEAMKMEHTVTAPTDGVVTALAVRTGQTVAMSVPLITVEPPPQSPSQSPAQSPAPSPPLQPVAEE